MRPSKGRGQNFLKEAWVVERMAAELAVGDGDLVIEVGPGLGALTGALLDTGASVTAIEIDEQLAAYLRQELGTERFSLVNTDARTVSIDEIVPEGRSYDFAANLPYSSAPVILRHFLEAPRPPERAICMVQREVALRMTARPPDLSILGVALQVYTEARSSSMSRRMPLFQNPRSSLRSFYLNEGQNRSFSRPSVRRSSNWSPLVSRRSARPY